MKWKDLRVLEGVGRRSCFVREPATNVETAQANSSFEKMSIAEDLSGMLLLFGRD
jgi:hypothetical protein